VEWCQGNTELLFNDGMVLTENTGVMSNGGIVLRENTGVLSTGRMMLTKEHRSTEK
jgi:hypothetical protein